MYYIKLNINETPHIMGKAETQELAEILKQCLITDVNAGEDPGYYIEETE